MNKKKLLIGIDIDGHLKKVITKSIKEFVDLPVRWHAEESYHIPLVDLGWVDENLISSIIDDLEIFSKEYPYCDILLKAITTTQNKDHAPQKIKIVGESSEELREIYESLMDLFEIGHGDVKTFIPHIALGHIRAHAWSELSTEPVIEKEFNVQCDIMTISLFEEARDGNKKIFQPIDVFELQ